jgi:hypothetical protein
MTRDVSLAIGVASARPLPYLSGAVNGAHSFHEWASKVGYDSTLLTDEQGDVTLQSLRQTLDAILAPAKGPIHRMLLYFAGHGLIREAEEGLWLLSDWHREQRAVAVEGLKRRLCWHGIQQLAIFSDSCRSLPPDISAADLAADPVLGRGPAAQGQPAIDKFIAAQDGAATFMVPGATPAEDRCLFSGVLMEGLWGKNPNAFSKLLKDKVTSRSLGAYLNAEVAQRAKSYQRKLSPTVSPTFPEGDDIYFYNGSGEPPPPPAFPDWPSPQSVASMGLRNNGDDSSFESVTPAPPTPLLARMRSQPRPERFETRAGFAVDGPPIRGIWTTPDVFAQSHGDPNWWRLMHRSDSMLLRSAPMLIEFADGTFAAAAAIPHFIGAVLRDERGVSALIYRSVYGGRDTGRLAERAIDQMESGALRAKDKTSLAVDLREGKHFDPVLGVISAYLYDSIGDVDSIRRMAFYYVERGQPIPFDIAMLAQLRGEWRDGLLWAHVPRVEPSAPTAGVENPPEWTYAATPDASGEVGGLWPWMRQGWTFLDEPAEDGSTLVTPGLIEIDAHLMPGRFTTLDPMGGRELARIFNLSK